MGRLVWITLSVSASLTIVLAFLGAADVVALEVLERSIPSAVELASSLLAAIVFGSLAGTQRAGANIEVSLALDLMPPRAAALLRRASLVLAGLILAYLAYRLSVLAARSVADREFATGLWGFPVYPVKAWCALACWVAVAEFLWQGLVTGPRIPTETAEVARAEAG